MVDTESPVEIASRPVSLQYSDDQIKEEKIIRLTTVLELM